MKKTSKYVVIAIVVVVIIYLGYDLIKPHLYPCESIFQQTTTKLGGDLETIQSKGSLFIGQQKIQELTERSQMLALNLKTCCTLSYQEILTSEEFLSCKNNTENYQQNLQLVVDRINEAEEAREEGNSRLVSEKVRDINSIIERSQDNFSSLSNTVEPALTRRASNNSNNPGTPGDVKSGSASETEPNNTILEPQEVQTGMTIEGEIAGGEDSDYYLFTYDGDLRDRIDVALENKSTTLRPEINFYNQDKSRFHEVYDITRGANLNAWIVVEPNTQYYVEVSRDARGGPYQLVISEPLKAYDQYEMNDDSFNATNIQLDETITANLLDKNDSDWYRIDNVPVEEVRIAFENGASELNPEIYVYNQNKTRITNKYNSTDGGNLAFNVSITVNTTLYVSVQVWNGSPTFSDYRLTVTES